MRIPSVVVVAALGLVLAGATKPIRLQPSSPWVVDYAEDSCRLIRTFGQGGEKTMLVFESEAPGQVDLLVAGKDLASFDEEVGARFLPLQATPFKGRAARTVKTGQPAILWSRIPLLPDALEAQLERTAADSRRRLEPGTRPPPDDLPQREAVRAARQEFVSKVTELEIDPRPVRQVILETGPLAAAMKAFDECSQDSLRDWGVDPETEDKIVRPAWPLNFEKWFSSADYPPGMVAQGEESEVKVRLLVDASGRVTKCTAVSHFTKAPQFNRVACDGLTRRARFAPAELADGTKVPSYYANRVVFRIAR